MYVCACVCMCRCMCACVRMCVCVCVCVQACACVWHACMYMKVCAFDTLYSPLGLFVTAIMSELYIYLLNMTFVLRILLQQTTVFMPQSIWKLNKQDT